MPNLIVGEEISDVGILDVVQWSSVIVIAPSLDE
jgi:hypothetical protein